MSDTRHTGAEPMHAGEVWLVGAGPGDPDLLTRKAANLLAQAEIVFYDALVTPEILALAPQAEHVAVGKRKGRHSYTQAAINECLAEAAQRGMRVVRLKGGDPSIFGRSGEEIDHLRAHNIAVHIVPGITAASACAAAAGVSLTRRGIAQRVQFVTAHDRNAVMPDLDWRALADPRASTIVYMGRSAATALAAGLQAAGASASLPVMAVENASTPDQRIFAATLASLATTTGALSGPVTLLIGNAFAVADPARATRMLATAD